MAVGIGGVNGVLNITVVKGEVPLLLPISLLRRLGACIDLPGGRIEWTYVNSSSPLEELPSGHLCVACDEFAATGWKTPTCSQHNKSVEAMVFWGSQGHCVVPRKAASLARDLKMQLTMKGDDPGAGQQEEGEVKNKKTEPGLSCCRKYEQPSLSPLSQEWGTSVNQQGGKSHEVRKRAEGSEKKGSNQEGKETVASGNVGSQEPRSQKHSCPKQCSEIEGPRHGCAAMSVGDPVCCDLQEQCEEDVFNVSVATAWLQLQVGRRKKSPEQNHKRSHGDTSSPGSETTRTRGSDGGASVATKAAHPRRTLNEGAVPLEENEPENDDDIGVCPLGSADAQSGTGIGGSGAETPAGKPLPGSKSKKIAGVDPLECSHPLLKNGQRVRVYGGNSSTMWETCLACGSRWSRLELAETKKTASEQKQEERGKLQRKFPRCAQLASVGCGPSQTMLPGRHSGGARPSLYARPHSRAQCGPSARRP